eukprot:TRINITY_DN3376_c0_g2_i3.p1 TRINITY_DN3376_c0_g2~~TRINITY_DN3376_c0_g2_i3.p1  ORF type:complete len:107 (+),score=28.76 TRINITY_DN3376_c0_g2_i3:202-522(+)
MLTIVFRLINEDEEAQMCFVNAIKKKPNDEELAVKLFYEYVKSGNVKKQTIQADKLFKQFKKEEYMFWKLVSTVKIGYENNFYFRLAEGIIDKNKKILNFNSTESM